MNSYAAKRLGTLLPTVLGLVTLVFLMVRMLPGDAATFIAGDNAGAEAVQAVREKLNLDEPMLNQYISYLAGVARFDFGKSLLTGLPVSQVLSDALPITVTMALASVLLSTIIAVPLGALAAYARWRGKKAADQGLTIFAMAVDTMPAFWLALVFILLFSLKLGWFPVSGKLDWGNPLGVAQRLALPIMVLGIAQVASVARVTRTAVLEALQEDYIRTARALGTPEMTLLFKYALKNAALPVVTVTGLGFGRLLGGTVILENIFSLPGLGNELVHGINSRDYPVVQGAILLYAFMFIAVNIATDLLYTRIDPRVRLT
jgi:ABC-type dipeptide/oligopeptide/nickel transport system permease component